MQRSLLSVVIMSSANLHSGFYVGTAIVSNCFTCHSIYNLTVKTLPEPAYCSLCDQYLLTFLKLRLNTGDVDLAFKFGINQITVLRLCRYTV